MLARRQPRGFSLVELVVATGVLVFGVYAVYAQFVNTRDVSRHRLYETQARLLARKRLAELRACTAADLKAAKGPERYETMPEDPRFHARWSTEAMPQGEIGLIVEVGWNPRDPEGQTFTGDRLVRIRGERRP